MSLRRLICPSISALPRRRVFGSADHSGEDRTLDRAGAERESVAEFVRKVVALLLRRERGDDFLEARVAA